MNQLTRRTLAVLVDNEAGVLSRVVRLFSGKGYNIESLAVGTTDDPKVSRITIEVLADDKQILLLSNQLRKLICVHSVKTLVPDHSIRRELVLIKVLAQSSETRNEVIQIADDFDISPACVARTLKSLAIEGYITRTGDEDDLRRNTVSITEKGLHTVSETHQTFERVDAAAFENMTAEEIEQLISLLSRVQDNLRRLEEGDNTMKGSASN